MLLQNETRKDQLIESEPASFFVSSTESTNSLQFSNPPIQKLLGRPNCQQLSYLKERPSIKRGTDRKTFWLNKRVDPYTIPLDGIDKTSSKIDVYMTTNPRNNLALDNLR